MRTVQPYAGCPTGRKPGKIQRLPPTTITNHKSPISALTTRLALIFAKPLIFNTKS